MTVTTTATNLIAGQPKGGRWLVQNLGAVNVFVARTEDDCTDTDGVRLAANEAFTIDEPVRGRNGGDGIWAVTESGNADVRIMRIG